MVSHEVSAALKLWSGYVLAKRTLLEKGVVRSFRSAEVDLAEWLVAQLFQGVLPPSKTHPCYDVEADNKRIQVRSLCKAPGNKNGYIIQSKDRTNDPRIGATHYAFVVFDDFVPAAVYLVSEAFVRQWGKTQIKRSDLEKTADATRILLSDFVEALHEAGGGGLLT
jgi:hypothetical protein